jgi:hypothetical protein
MVQAMKASTSRGRNMESASSHGPMEVPIRENSMRTTLRGRGFISGPMAASTKVSGATTRWKATESLYGPTVANTRENT